ncbi:zinc finger protein 675-like isoform X2 [Leptidea sinapis]|uniref:zinc finger protein 675-like isoform X2 n=1 Tax=Leptidea sinapis TaxID=189913 RepID=UPI0021C4B4C0|nr:zinc finger protein 675-like isoform X2 [Leptidea sinapis]
MEERESLLCISCLCVGRTLKVLHDGELKKFFIDVLREVPLANLNCLAPEICWECEAIIKKSLRFREQVKDSYRILQTYTIESLRDYLLSDVSRPPRLKVCHNKPVLILPDTHDEHDEIKIEYKDVTNLDDKESQQSESDNDINKEEVPTVVYDVKSEYNIKDTNEDEHTTCFISRYIGDKQNVDGTYSEDKASQLYGSDENLFRGEIQTVTCDVKPEYNLRNEYSDRGGIGNGGENITKLCHEDIKDDIFTETDILMTNETESTETGYIKSQNYCHDSAYSNKKHRDKPGSHKKAQKGRKNGKIIGKYDTEEHVSKKRKTRITEQQICNRDRKHRRKLNKNIEFKRHDIPKSVHKQIVSKVMSQGAVLEKRKKQTQDEIYINSDYKCDSCTIGFLSFSSYKAHMISKHSSDIDKYKLDKICNTVTPPLEMSTSHYKGHIMTRYDCGVCQERSLDVDTICEHHDTTHTHLPDPRETESETGKCADVSVSLETHKTRMQCSDCDKTFSHRAGLMNHRIVVHEYKNEFPCNVCKKVFRWKNSLKRHLEKHTTNEGSGGYCSACGIGFSSVSSLQRHLRNSLKHVTPDQLRFICDHCKRRFADKTKLRDHIEDKHLNRTTYQCYICHKPSKSRVGLDQHIRNVHKGRPNNKICHYCGKGFPTKVQLESHIRTHTGERPFICEYCPTTFSQQSNLYKHHRQVHQNIKKKKAVVKRTKEECHGTTSHEDPSIPIALIQYMALPDSVFSI